MPSPLEPGFQASLPRPAARALIVRDGKLLTIHYRDPHKGEFYVLPGGGQRFGETLHEALHRECREELHAEIEIGELAYVREYIGPHHEFPEAFAGFHAVECVFRCALPKETIVQDGTSPDLSQVGPVWIPLSDVERFPLYPKWIRGPLARGQADSLPLYLGDIN